MNHYKFFALAILTLGNPAYSFAETLVRVCGPMSYEKTKNSNSNEMVYAIFYGNYRFEISNDYLEKRYKDSLEFLRKEAENNSKKKMMGACAVGYFAGDFTWSGFDTGGVELTQLKNYETLREIPTLYKNLER